MVGDPEYRLWNSTDCRPGVDGCPPLPKDLCGFPPASYKLFPPETSGSTGRLTPEIVCVRVSAFFSGPRVRRVSIRKGIVPLPFYHACVTFLSNAYFREPVVALLR